MIPSSGGEHQYLIYTFGSLSAYLFDWTSVVLLKPGSNAILTVAFAEYFMRTLQYGSDPSPINENYVRLTAAIACISCTLICAISSKLAHRVQNVLTFSKILALLVIVGAGFYRLFSDPSTFVNNFEPAFSGSSTDPRSYTRAMNHGLWAFEGWNNLNVVAGDLINPSKNLPLSIWTGFAMVMTLYLLTVVSYYAVLPSSVVVASSTIGINFGMEVFGQAGSLIIPLFVMAATFGGTLSNMISSSSLVVVCAEEGNLPRIFHKKTKPFGTAIPALLLQLVLSIIFVSIGSFDWLIQLYTVPQWFFYGMCIFALLVLRYREPAKPRPYRVFLSTPILFLIACGFLIFSSAFSDEAEIMWGTIGAAFLILTGIPVWWVLIKKGGFKSAAEAIKSKISGKPEVKPHDDILSTY